jgi:hypothetical protein
MRRGILCAKCGGVAKKTTKEAVAELENKYGTYCDYSEVVYTGANKKITVICPVHGRFTIDFAAYLYQSIYPCPKCGTASRASKQWDTKEDFLSKASSLYGDTIDFSKFVYKGSKVKGEAVCKKHGSYWQIPNAIISGRNGCPKCSYKVSRPETELTEFINNLGLPVLSNSRGLLDNGKEIDIFIPGLKVGIEFNGLRWHGEDFRDKGYHLDKLNAANREGIRLIQIFSDEWDTKREIVLSRLTHILNKGADVRYARKLECRVVLPMEAYSFYESTHIQGGVRSQDYAVGLYEGGTLVACMSFGESRFSKELGQKELLRFSSIGSVVGGFSRLLKAYLKALPEVYSIVSYSDKRWSVGDVYRKNSFIHSGTSSPGYYWCKNNKRYTRHMFQKHKLHKILEVFNPSLTEVENCKANGYYRIFDCGMDRWKLACK